MKVVGPRTFLELRVGENQSIEVVIHVRRADIPWFNGAAKMMTTTATTSSNRSVVDSEQNKETKTNGIFLQLLNIIQTSILPRMFADEIEKNYYSYIGQVPPPDLGPGGIPIITPIVTSNNGNTTTTSGGGGGITGKKSSYNTKRQRISKRKLDEIKRLEQEEARKQRSNEKDVYYATNGSEGTIQVAYRLEALPKYGHATMVYQPSGNFMALKKIQQRILVWCYPINNDTNHHDEIHNDNGLYRPEMVPISTYVS
jgi:hypothetical protein